MHRYIQAQVTPLRILRRGAAARERRGGEALLVAALLLVGCQSAAPAKKPVHAPVARACAETIAPPPRSTRWAQVVTTARSSCALSEAGQVVCWGDGRAHQLGVGAPGYRHVPAATCSTQRLARLWAGPEEVCGLNDAGEAWCWGARLGDVPRRWAPGQTFAELALSAGLICGRQARGEVWCGVSADAAPRRWGKGMRGLGASGDEVCALGDDREVVCADQALVRGGRARRIQHEGEPLMSLTSGVGQHVCGVASDGALWCWGSNARGQLGQPWRALPGSPNRTVHAPAAQGGRWIAAATGAAHTCALDAQGKAWCWGANRERARAPYGGQLGAGDLMDRDTPTPVLARAPLAQLAAGGAHSCAITQTTRQVQCWGDDRYGQVGEGPPRARPLPRPRLQKITWPKGVTMRQVQGHDTLVCALDAEGKVWCASDTLPLRGSKRPEPRRAELPMLMMGVPGQVVQLATGDAQACALNDQDEVYCWGDNRGAHIRSYVSDHPVANPSRVSLGRLQIQRLIWSGGQMCALDVDSRLWCWGMSEAPAQHAARGGHAGHNAHVGLSPRIVRRGSSYRSVKLAQVGVGVQIAEVVGDLVIDAAGVFYAHDRDRPAQLRRITRPGATWRRVSASRGHACALDAEGRAWCWGRGDEGQLGDGVLHARPLDARAPVRVKTDARFVEVYAFEGTSCALTAAGEAWCWGRNLHGELGARTRSAPVAQPTQVATRARFVSLHASRLDASDAPQQICGLGLDGAALCWGMGQSRPQALSKVHTFSALLAVGGEGLALTREAPQEVVRWSWKHPQRLLHAPANQLRPISVAPATRP